MTEEIASTPGWVDERLDELFSRLPLTPTLIDARRAYSDCLADSKQPGAPSDMLGAEFTRCRATLHRTLQAAGVSSAELDPGLEALEAEITSGS